MLPERLSYAVEKGALRLKIYFNLVEKYLIQKIAAGKLLKWCFNCYIQFSETKFEHDRHAHAQCMEDQFWNGFVLEITFAFRKTHRRLGN